MKRLLNTLYVTNPDALVRKKDDAISVSVDGERVMSVPFHVLEGVVLFGHVGVARPFWKPVLNGASGLYFSMSAGASKRGLKALRAETSFFVESNTGVRTMMGAAFIWQRGSFRPSCTTPLLYCNITRVIIRNYAMS